MITLIKNCVNINTFMTENDPLTERIIACCYKVHSELGPGFKEKVYHNALKLEFDQEELNYETEKQFEVCYNSNKVGKLIVDLIVESKVIIEIKALTGKVPSVFKYQLLSYLKVGLLINFGNKSCQVNRFVN